VTRATASEQHCLKSTNLHTEAHFHVLKSLMIVTEALEACWQSRNATNIVACWKRWVGARVTWLQHRPAVCCQRTEREERTWRLRATWSGAPGVRFELSRVNRDRGSAGLVHSQLHGINFAVVPEIPGLVRVKCRQNAKLKRIDFYP